MDLSFALPIVLCLIIIVLVGIIIYFNIISRRLRDKIDFLSNSFTFFKDTSDNLCFQLANNLKDIVFIKDKSCRYVVANDRLSEVLKQSGTSQFIGLTDFDFYPRNDAEDNYAEEKAIISGTSSGIADKIRAYKNEHGELLWFSFTKAPLFDSDKKIVGLIGIGKDITEQKENQERLMQQTNVLYETNMLLEQRQESLENQSEKFENERNQLRILIDNMPDRIYFKDEHARFILCNTCQIDILKGETHENIEGKTDFDFYPKDVAELFFNDDMEIIRKGDPIINKEEIGFDMDGNQLVISTTKVPIKDKDGKVYALIGIGRDITRQKEIEHELIKHTEHLKEINTLLEERQEEIRVQSERIEYDHNQLRTLIDNIPDFIYVKDRKGRFSVANKSMANTLEVKHADDLLFKSNHDFYPKELADQLELDEQNLMNSGKSLINKIEPIIKHDGSKSYILSSKIPFKDKSGEVIGIIGIGRDISEQKEYEEKLREQSEFLKEINVQLEERQVEIETKAEEVERERNNLRTLIDTMPDVIYFKDDQARFVLGNSTQIKVLKAKDHEDIVGKTDYDFYTKEIADIFFNDDMEIIKSGIAIVNKEEIGFDELGKQRFVSTTKVPIIDRNGKIVGLIGIGRDITKQKRTEQKLIEQSNNLKEINVLLEERQEEIQQQSEELSSQAEVLQDANLELERLNATKNKFFSIIAHDLKNPFHAISGFSELLLRNFEELEEERKLEIVELIKSSSETAYNLLENLLQWARAQTNRIKYSPEEVDLCKIIEQNIKIYKAYAENKSIDLNANSLPDKCLAYVDSEMINTVIRNLINNAVKFTEHGGKVTISCEELNDYEVKINIEDTGVGIAQEDIDRLFKIDQYFTSPGTSGEEGTGLGLIISDEFIRKNKGKFDIESHIGKGTRFSLILPRKG